NNHTNVNAQARFVVYGTRDLGKELGAISTLVMLENISARIAENAKIGRATWLYIDEFHTVLDKEYSAKYLYTLWKKVQAGGTLYRDHPEYRRHAAELYSSYHAGKFRVYRSAETGECRLPGTFPCGRNPPVAAAVCE